MKTIIVNMVGALLIGWAAFLAANILLYLLYWAMIISLFYPMAALIIISVLTVFLAFWLGRAVTRPKVYKLHQ